MQFHEFLLLFLVSIPSAIIIAISTLQYPHSTLQNNVNAYKTSVKSDKTTAVIMNDIIVHVIPKPTLTPFPTLIPIVNRNIDSTANAQTENSTEWGVAKQVDEHTYTIKVAYDNAMSSPQDIVNALNTYRSTHGKNTLSWDDRLGAYAQTRVETFKSMGTTDAHAGFENYISNEDGFSKLGFNSLGENSYFGGPLDGVHLIEWAFAQSPGHDANQLGDWSSVGVGVNETAVNLVFGGN